MIKLVAIILIVVDFPPQAVITKDNVTALNIVF